MSNQWSISASFSWNDFQHIRVYGLKPDGTIVEWQYDGSWTGPSVLGPKADPGTTLAVVHTENNSGVHVSVPKHFEPFA